MIEDVEVGCLNDDALVSIIDHVDVRDDVRGLRFALESIMHDYIADVDAVVHCLHRFASRSQAASKHQLMVDMMAAAYKECPYRVIRDVLQQYAGQLDPSEGRHGSYQGACRCGRLDLVKQAVVNNRKRLDVFSMIRSL